MKVKVVTFVIGWCVRNRPRNMCRVLNRIFTKGVSRGIAQVKRRNVPSHGPELETWTMDPPPVLLTEPTLTEAFCFCVQTARGWKMCVDSASRCVITNRSSLPSSLLSPPPLPSLLFAPQNELATVAISILSVPTCGNSMKGLPPLPSTTHYRLAVGEVEDRGGQDTGSWLEPKQKTK